MKLLVISHKETWADPASPCGYSTVGGFPFQMAAISELFDQTQLLLLQRAGPPPAGLRPLAGHNLLVQVLPEPAGANLSRKLALLIWLPRYFSAIWNAISQADAVHAPVPGDIGLVGILLTLAQGKPLFVRHCGTWAKPQSLADRFLFWLLERIAGGSNVVLATGGSEFRPSAVNRNIVWIFSTSLTREELNRIHPAQVWAPGSPLRLITVGRLAVAKNIQSILLALPAIRQVYPDVHLDIVGDGDYRWVLEELALQLRVNDSVTFYGNLEHKDVLAALSRSHLFVFPSLREGFPKAVLEALACGLPVIATRTSAIPQLLKPGCGLLLDVPDTQSLQKAILSLISTPLTMAQMGLLAQCSVQGYTLEAWRDTIAAHLHVAWNRNLREHT